MIELVDTLPDTNVQPAEYKRLLGFPRERVLSGKARDLAEWARAWYSKNGRPWIYAREAQSLNVQGDQVTIDRISFTSTRVQPMFEQAGANGAILVALSAGPEVEEAAHKAWLGE